MSSLKEKKNSTAARTKKEAAKGREGSITSRRRPAPQARPGQPGGRRVENRKRRTEALVEAGLCLFLERGVEAVTIDDIVKRAGMAKGSFYRYFADKKDLVEGIIEPVSDALNEALDRASARLEETQDRASLFGAYQELGLAIILITTGHPEVIRLYLQESRGPKDSDRGPIRAIADLVTERSIELTEVAVEHGLLRVLDPRISALAVVGAVERLMLAVLRGDLDAPPAEIAGILIGLVLDGIRAR